MFASLALNYILYIRTSVSNTHVRVEFFANYIQELRKGRLSSLAVKVPVEVAVEVASSSLLFTSFAFYSFSNKPVLDYTSSQHGTNQYWFIINKKI